MRNPRVIAEKSLCVVQHFLPHIVWDNELANITLPVVKNNIEKFDYDTEKKILFASTNLQERLSFLIDLIEKYKDDFNIVTELIESLDDPYRSITDKSNRAAIENNHMNKILLERLKLLNISRHIEKMMICFVSAINVIIKSNGRKSNNL